MWAVTHLSGPQFPQKGAKKIGLKKLRFPQRAGIWGAGWGVLVTFLTLFALHPCLMKLDRCFQFSGEPTGNQENWLRGPRLEEQNQEWTGVGPLGTLSLGWTPLPTRSSPCTLPTSGFREMSISLWMSGPPLYIWFLFVFATLTVKNKNAQWVIIGYTAYSSNSSSSGGEGLLRQLLPLAWHSWL